jgi:hypothetical protein
MEVQMAVKSRRLLTALTLFLALNLASVLYAQFSSTLEGVVQDSSGAVIPKAAVELTNLGTRVVQTTTTDASGFYRFVSLAPGQYHVKVTATGFNEGAAELTLLTAQTMNLPITLIVAAQKQEVQVTAQAPVLDTSDSRTEMTLGKVALNDLPLSGRALVNLVAVAPGVEGLGTEAYGSPGSAVDNFSTETQIDASANGRGSVANMFIVDGLDITSNIRPGVLNLMPNPDSIQEASVQVNTFDVDYGRAASIQMVMTTKSGTDQFHGQASDYFNYQALWAGTEFVHSYAPFHTNNISASVGGPILSKSHLYFFFDIEPLRSSTSTGNGLVTFEDPQFTAWAQQNYPNTLGTQLLVQFPPTHAIATGVSTTAADIFPTTCGTSTIPCNLPMTDVGIFNSTNYRNGLQYNFRIDKYFSKDRVYGNYYRTGLDTGGGAVRPGMEETDHYITKSLQLNETHNFAPTTINEASFGLLRVEGISPLTGDFKIPVVSVVGVGTGIGDGFADGDFIQHNYHWRDVLMQMHGTHILKFGYEGWHGDDIALFAPCYGQPNFEFLNLLELVQDNAYAEGSLAYNPLTGQPAPGEYGFTDTTNGVFAQDTWKVRRNFTLNYGLRWDEYGNPYPKTLPPNIPTILANFFLGPGITPNQQIATGFMIQKAHVFNHAPMAFSPRVGFAWDTNGKGKWVVRGGFGIFHDWIDLGNDENGLKGNPPGWVLPTFIRGTTTAPVFGEGTSNTYPYGFPYPPFVSTGLNGQGGLVGEQPSVGGIDANLTSPSTYNYTVTLERELQRHLVASVGYSGSHSINLVTGGGQVSATTYGVDINRFAGDLIENDNVLTRLNHSFGSITYSENGSKATYNALIVSLQGRFSRGFISASYTRSSSYDDSQIYPTTNVSQYWSPSNWDAPNRFAFTGSYSIPGLANANPFLRHLTTGWEPSVTTILQSGLPYTVATNAPFEPIFNASGTQVIGMQPGSGDYNADGFDYDFPNAPSAGYKTSTSRSAYLNGLFTAADFPVPTMGTEGNEAANAFRGPGFAEADLAVLKNDKIGERLGLQLRFEFYNVFNRPNLNGVDSNLPDSTFGVVTGQYNPRWIQFGVKLTF